MAEVEADFVEVEVEDQHLEVVDLAAVEGEVEVRHQLVEEDIMEGAEEVTDTVAEEEDMETVTVSHVLRFASYLSI